MIRLQDLQRRIQEGSLSQAHLALAVEEVYQRALRLEEMLDWRNDPEKAGSNPVNLEDCLNDAIDLMSQDFPFPVSIGLDPSLTRLPTVAGDRLLFIQIFANLLNNAAESIVRRQQHLGRIFWSGASLSGEPSRIQIHCRDNGRGIPPDQLDRIFEKGFTTKETRGSGIGLFWCREVLQAMGADICAESAGLDQGLSIILEIPVC